MKKYTVKIESCESGCCTFVTMTKGSSEKMTDDDNVLALEAAADLIRQGAVEAVAPASQTIQ